MDAVSLDAVSFAYAGSEVPALSGITLSVGRGETLALLGADGSGRSTLLYLLAGLMVRFYPGRLTGACFVGGASCATRRPAGVGLLLEDPATQFSGLAFTVFDEVALALEGREAPEATSEKVEAALAQVGAAGLAGRNPFALSGGEAKRVALATLLVDEPRLLLLDEPFAQLDPASREDVRQVLATLTASGVTVILSGSDAGEVATLTDRAVVLRRGELVFHGSLRAMVEADDAESWGVSLPLVTRVARKARGMGLFKGPLPVTLDDIESTGWCA